MKSSRFTLDPLHRVSYYDAESDCRHVFLTNHFTIPAFTVAGRYKSRWQIERLNQRIKPASAPARTQ